LYEYGFFGNGVSFYACAVVNLIVMSLWYFFLVIFYLLCLILAQKIIFDSVLKCSLIYVDVLGRLL